MTVRLTRAFAGLPAGASYDGSADVELDLVTRGNAEWSIKSVISAGGPGDTIGSGSSASGSGYLGQAISQSAMIALSAVAGDECLRTDLGTGGLRYELTALPATTPGNWQPVQGVLADGSLVTMALVDGKMPRRLLVSVASGCQVTVTVGGVTLPVLPETVAGEYHEIAIFDDAGAAQPTTLTVQRSSGSGTTSTYSLET